MDAVVTGAYYTSIFHKVRQELLKKQWGKLSERMLFLHGNGLAYKASITIQKLAIIRFQIVQHLHCPCSLAHRHYAVLGFQGTLEGHRFLCL